MDVGREWAIFRLESMSRHQELQQRARERKDKHDRTKYFSYARFKSRYFLLECLKFLFP